MRRENQMFWLILNSVLLNTYIQKSNGAQTCVLFTVCKLWPGVYDCVCYAWWDSLTNQPSVEQGNKPFEGLPYFYIGFSFSNYCICLSSKSTLCWIREHIPKWVTAHQYWAETGRKSLWLLGKQIVSVSTEKWLSFWLFAVLELLLSWKWQTSV